MTKVVGRTPRRVPPLNPLRAFEAAARHQSFTHAADELCVTQGAISRSVKALEDYLGSPLFERTGHGIVLTDRSKKFARALTDVFVKIEEETEKLVGVRAPASLTVRAYTSFLIGFLMPRLADFQLHHPHIKVRVVAATDQTDVNREQVDVRIRYGHGKWTDLESVFLFHDELTPVCSPNLLPPAGRPYPVEILKNQTLLRTELRPNDWPEWLAAAGAGDLVPRDNLHFDELSVTFQAAIAGIGVAMGQRVYVRDELSSGRLFEPFDRVLNRDLGYYLVYPPERREARPIAAFREWLVHQFEELEA